MLFMPDVHFLQGSGNEKILPDLPGFFCWRKSCFRNCSEYRVSDFVMAYIRVTFDYRVSV